MTESFYGVSFKLWALEFDMVDFNSEMAEELLKISQAQHKSQQEKYNAIQALAKKYDIPIEVLMKKIIMEWINDDKEKKSGKKG